MNEKKFKFGDKVMHCNRKAIFLGDVSEEYAFKSKMSKIAYNIYDIRNAFTSKLKRGWKR